MMKEVRPLAFSSVCGQDDVVGNSIYNYLKFKNNDKPLLSENNSEESSADNFGIIMIRMLNCF